MNQFKFTPAQQEFIKSIKPYHRHICCYGGTGSGKTIMFLALLIMRCGLYPRSRHLIVRGASNTIKTTIITDFKRLTMYNLFEANPWKINLTDLVITFENGSTIQCVGSDNEEHFRKVQGARYATIYMNECSKLQTKHLFGSEGIMGRLTQGKIIITKEEASKMQEGSYQYGEINNAKALYYEVNKCFYYDFNPPTKAHWTYKYFIKQIHPITELSFAQKNKNFYVGIINPVDNPYSTAGLFEELEEQGSRSLKSLYYGEFQDVGGQLISRDMFQTYDQGDLEQEWLKIFFTVDVAYRDDKQSDWSVIAVWGINLDKKLYLFDILRFKGRSTAFDNKLRGMIKIWQDGFKNGSSGLKSIVIEKNGNARLIDQLYTEYGSGLIDDTIPRVKDKFSRFLDVQGFIENGNVFLPSPDVQIQNRGKASSFLEPFLFECESFSQNEEDYEHDDQVDCLTDASQIALTFRQVRPIIMPSFVV